MKTQTLLTLATLLATSAPIANAQPAPASRPATSQPSDATSKVIVDDATEKVLAGAMNFLESKQSPGGGWSGNGNNHQAAITAYVLVAFLANGNTPGEGPHGKTVQRAVEYLLDCVGEDGYIHAPTGEHNMYGHGIACIALGEAYGMLASQGGGPGGGRSKTEVRLRVALEKSIRLIVQTQNEQGGWRYQPRVADADISVTVLQATALRVAKNNGFDVPQRTLDKAANYVRACFDDRSGGFFYQAGGGSPGFARSCAAIYSLQVLGNYDDPMVGRGSTYVNEQFGKQMEWFTYGNFYGAPAHYMIGGAAWEKWYGMAKAMLLPKVQTEGPQSWWKPLEGHNGVNEVFATAVYATVLAMPYQYLPVYQR